MTSKMRSFTVPVSFSSLLLPTVAPDLSLSLSSGGSFVGWRRIGRRGLGGLGSCALADETRANSPIKSEDRRKGALQFVGASAGDSSPKGYVSTPNEAAQFFEFEAANLDSPRK